MTPLMESDTAAPPVIAHDVERGTFTTPEATVGVPNTQEVPSPVMAAAVGEDRVKSVGNSTSTYEDVEAATEPAGVNPTVHFDVAPWAYEFDVNVTVEPSDAALAIVAVPRSTMAMTTAPAVSLFMR